MIDLSKVTFTYQGQTEPSLRDVSLHVEPGECVLVTGPSGCGKSTLLRLLNGLVPHFFQGELEGEVRVDGIVPGEVSLYDQAGRTGSVFQNPRTQFYTTDTTSELAFTLENRGLPAADIVERVERVANDLGLASLMDRSLFELSGGEKQRVACACVQVAGPNVVLLDEPTANLDYDATLELAEIVRAWKRSGKTILIAEHRLAWILPDVTALVVMKEGRIVCERHGDGLRGVDEGFCRQYGLRSPRLQAPDEAVIKPGCEETEADASPCVIENLHFAYRHGPTILDFDRIPLTTGKVTAVVGRNGRGKTTFLRCLAGLERRDVSVLRVGDQPWDRKARLKNVFLIQQDVNCQLFTQSVREEVEISLPEGADVGIVDEVLGELDLASVADSDPFTLSGGQKQRVAIACAVASGRRVILFDEPTSGLGLDHMLRFAEVLRRLTTRGCTVVVVTHDNELISVAADRLLVL